MTEGGFDEGDSSRRPARDSARLEGLDPDDVLERAEQLFEAGSFSECRKLLDAPLNRSPASWCPEDLADAHYYAGACDDRRERAVEADHHFRRAHSLSPEEHPPALRLSEEEFRSIVAAALDSIPARFDPYLGQVSVVVRDYPGSEVDDPFVLGLYLGVPRIERDQDSRDALDSVFIYKRNHELGFDDAAELREEIRKTVIHEIAHHFGLDEDDMGSYA